MIAFSVPTLVPVLFATLKSSEFYLFSCYREEWLSDEIALLSLQCKPVHLN